MIRLTVPSIDESDQQAVREVLATGFLVQGKHVAAFEAEIARYVGCEHAVAVSNCTAALQLALLALGVGTGDKVAVTAYSWPATANVIILCGAEPVFVDIEAETFNMDPAALDRVLQREGIKVVLPVHTFGRMADMPRLLEVAGRHGAAVIEDAACALGAELNGRRAGSLGIMGCFSFHPRKAITTGEGGMVTTNDSALARQLRALRNHGLDPDSAIPDFVMAGYNMRITEFQAALGVSQLAKIERIIDSRRTLAAAYAKLFAGSNILPSREAPGSRHVFQSFVVLLPPDAASRRSEIIASLKRGAIETTIGTYHMPMTTYFRKRGRHVVGDFPVTDHVALRAMSLPLYEGLTQSLQAEVVTALLNQLEIAGSSV